MADGGQDQTGHLGNSFKTLNITTPTSTIKQNSKTIIFQNAEKRAGFFYRMSKDNRNEVMGVYAKCVKYCDVDLTSGEDFEAIWRHIVNSGEPHNNCLGVCFFGVWCYENKTGKKVKKIIQVPVKVEGHTAIWETKCTSNDGQETITLTDNGVYYNHIHYNRKSDPRIYYRHTEEMAKTHLDETKAQSDLWQDFLKLSTKHIAEEIAEEKPVLECIGFNFLSYLDACDDCFHKYIFPFQSAKMSSCPPRNSEGSYEVDTLSDELPFIITFTANKFYNPQYQFCKTTIFNDQKYSASVHFQPQNEIVRLGKLEENFCTFTTEEEINHHESVEVREMDQLNFIVLKVNGGKSVIVVNRPKT